MDSILPPGVETRFLAMHYRQARARLMDPPARKRPNGPTPEPDPRSCVQEEKITEVVEEPRRPPPAVLIEVERPITTGINCRTIVEAVAAYYGLSIIELTSDRREASVVRPRQVAMYLARQLTVKSLPEIGRIIGDRDHTTVMSAVRRIESLMKVDAALCAQIDDLMASLTRDARQAANDNLSEVAAQYAEKDPYWTPARVQELALMFSRGDRMADLARHFRRAEPTILAKIHRFNLKRSPVYQRTHGQ